MDNSFEMDIANIGSLNNASVFGERLRACLKKSRITGSSLAKELKICPSTVSSWLTGTNYPSLLVFSSICKMLHVDPTWLLGLSNNKSLATPPKNRLLTKESLLSIESTNLSTFSFVLEQEQVPFPIPAAMEFIFDYNVGFAPGYYCLAFWKKTLFFSLHRIVADANKLFIKTLSGPILLPVNELQNEDFQIFGIAHSAYLDLQ